MESDKSKQQAEKPTEPAEKKAEGEMEETSKLQGEDLNKAAPDFFQQYMQSFNNKHTMQMYGQKHLEELMKKDRSFWTSQPVPSPESLVNGELKDVSGPIEKKTIDEVSKEPGKLPEGYQWDIVDMDNAEQVEELYQHLYDHYVEDDDGYFRFNYGKDFIRWALTPPGYEKDMLISIRDSNTKKMVAFIAGVIINLRIEGKLIRATEVNFLCVLKDMRKLKFAPRLIQEVTRRSNVKGVWQGFYTSGTMLPTPIAQARYYHRSLNPKKLVDVNFSSKPRTHSMKIHEKIFAVPDELKISGVRPMVEGDVPKVRQFLVDYLSKHFQLYEEYSKVEVKHFFLPRPKVLSSYVVIDNNQVVGFISYYHLPSSILRSSNYKDLNAAYSYYIIPGKHSLAEMYEAALILAKKEGFDVFNALDILENQTVFDDLLFKPGDGFLQYYMFNWKLKNTHLLPSQVGKVLV